MKGRRVPKSYTLQKGKGARLNLFQENKAPPFLRGGDEGTNRPQRKGYGSFSRGWKGALSLSEKKGGKRQALLPEVSPGILGGKGLFNSLRRHYAFEKGERVTFL